MKYLIVGTGGTGGCIGGYLASYGKDVTFIARGAHLKAMKERGLIIHSSRKGEIHIKDVKCSDGSDDIGKFDVIFVCVKGYSIYDIIPIIKKTSHEKTVVIPILNTLTAGEKLKEALPDITVLDGCIYVSGYVSAPGEITQGVMIFRVVFGPMENTEIDMYSLKKIQDDLMECQIDGIISDNIKRDTFRKFSFTSPLAATGAYFDVNVGEVQKQGKYREMFIALLKELEKVADTLNINLTNDLVKENLDILDGLAPNITASMQKDIKKGKQSEKDELIFDIVRISEKNGIEVPGYKKIAEHFGYGKNY
ncbi:ketopantoate reductase family protein [Clostridium pasteurianum]|uniref:2-dehydropantoate 2-reductase n=1 Tax=Clostridium pasteurianum BC1 TaxID=86416 RepID=R4K314_CLOPA|nr:2-dehydropantoate 2-reductase [Clostridium pasteurianum]AGK96121.1 2-dehydropantoate 2-reductase [Clostridium pasteurianum BC1]